MAEIDLNNLIDRFFKEELPKPEEKYISCCMVNKSVSGCCEINGLLISYEFTLQRIYGCD